jgi:predicted  nucleic acid-binding Zn-ribbon protein
MAPSKGYDYYDPYVEENPYFPNNYPSYAPPTQQSYNVPQPPQQAMFSQNLMQTKKPEYISTPYIQAEEFNRELGKVHSAVTEIATKVDSFRYPDLTEPLTKFGEGVNALVDQKIEQINQGMLKKVDDTVSNITNVVNNLSTSLANVVTNNMTTEKEISSLKIKIDGALDSMNTSLGTKLKDEVQNLTNLTGNCTNSIYYLTKTVQTHTDQINALQQGSNSTNNLEEFNKFKLEQLDQLSMLKTQVNTIKVGQDSMRDALKMFKDSISTLTETVSQIQEQLRK